jgi:hypothetical protein
MFKWMEKFNNFSIKLWKMFTFFIYQDELIRNKINGENGYTPGREQRRETEDE